MNQKTFKFKKYGKNHPLSLTLGHYNNGTLAIRLITWEEGYPEPYANLTVNLGFDNDKYIAFLDNENLGEEITKTLIDNNFGEPTGRGYETTYATFVEFKFNPETLKQYDEEGVEEYDAYFDAYKMSLELLAKKGE